MQFKNIPRDLVLKPLQAVSGIVERRQTLPILANVLFEHKGNTLTTIATDLELQISAKVEVADSGDQSITVAARKLQAEAAFPGLDGHLSILGIERDFARVRQSTQKILQFACGNGD